MKRILLLLLWLPLFAQAQPYTDPFMQNLHGFNVYLGGMYDINSTGLTNNLYNNYLNSDFITDESKHSADKTLKDQNRFGAGSQFNLLCLFPGKKEASGLFFIQIKSRSLIGSLFSKELYNTALYGNSQYQGQNVNLGSFNYSQFSYKTVGFGYLSPGKGGMTYGGSLGLVFGSRYINANASSSSLYTGPYGDSISLITDFQAKYNNPVPFLDAQGYGLSLDLHALVKLSEGRHYKSMLGVGLSDFGFVSWAKNSMNIYSVNGPINYGGEAINPLDGSVISGGIGPFTDSLRRSFNGTSGENFTSGANDKPHPSLTRMLPGQIRINYQYSRFKNPVDGDKFRLNAGVEYFMFADHLPEIYATGDWQLYRGKSIFNDVRLMAGGSFLGYGYYGLTLGMETDITPDFKLTIGTNHLEAYLSPASTFGQGVFFSMQYAIEGIKAMAEDR
jgi:hypothetical protein